MAHLKENFAGTNAVHSVEYPNCASLGVRRDPVVIVGRAGHHTRATTANCAGRIGFPDPELRAGYLVRAVRATSEWSDERCTDADVPRSHPCRSRHTISRVARRDFVPWWRVLFLDETHDDGRADHLVADAPG